jgi:hypothetical protein
MASSFILVATKFGVNQDVLAGFELRHARLGSFRQNWKFRQR